MPTSTPHRPALPPVPAETVRDWVAAHQASETLRQFQQLLADVFPGETEFGFTLESDPDEEEDAVVCVTTLQPDNPVPALAYYDQFVTKWARTAAPPLSGLFTLLVRQSGDA